MKRWLLLLAVAMSGCAQVPPARDPGLFHDALFAPPAERIDAGDVFAVSPAMRRYLREEIAGDLALKGRLKGLFDALYQKGALKLEYDAAVTRNAGEAFDERAGNCLSLVIMTAALAKELGLQVFYQRVSADDAWSRSGDIYFAAAHVNVTLARPRNDPRMRFDERHQLTIDFIPPRANQVPRTSELSERTIVAMFMNNRAAEAYARGRLDDAYWWAREAISRDPLYTSAYNTLGVIYKGRGRFAEAEKVLRHVIEREPGNLNAMQNLALVYHEQGREQEADALTVRIERAQPHPPFHFFNLGQEAMQAGDFRTAKAMFAREIERDANYHEFHYWLAAACLRLGETDLAKKHLAIALEQSATRGDHDLYAAKLRRLKAGR